MSGAGLAGELQAGRPAAVPAPCVTTALIIWVRARAVAGFVTPSYSLGAIISRQRIVRNVLEPSPGRA